MQENLVATEILVFGVPFPPGKLACMDSIHTRIKELRKALGWSHQRLADEVSKLEGLATPLAWTAVQQWERESGTAPKRTRLPFVAQALGTTVEALLEPEIRDVASPAIAVNEHRPQYIAGLPRAVEVVVDALALLTPSAWAMVRGALDTVIGHPEMGDEVAANVLMVLQAGPGKRVATA